MKILERRILHDPGTAFSHIRYGQFSLPCHAHVEFELMYITSGRGLQFAGDGVEPYRAGDLALLGSGLPHFHLCDRVRLGGDGEASSGEVLQFPPDLFPQNMERLGDYAEIRRLLECSRRGIRFGDRVLAAEVGRLVRSVDALSGTERLVRLYEILGRLARCADYPVDFAGRMCMPGFVVSRIAHGCRRRLSGGPFPRAGFAVRARSGGRPESGGTVPLFSGEDG